MANQNFRVRNGINVGTAVTITTTEYQVGNTRIHSSGVEARSITVTDNAGISTVPQLKLTGRLYDTNNNVGTGTSVLVSTGIGVSWIAIATAALQGVQGVQGTFGTQGTQGTQGVQGTQGIQGIQGTQGVQGIQGTTGTQGTQGTSGTLGTQGTTGTQGTSGTLGTQGTTGAQGTQGITGSQGTTGTQGIQGITGSQGISGAQGITGSQGTTGAQGTTGVQGTTGAQGATGSQGTTGAQGATGTQGATGSQGTTGAQGATGTQGATGSQGTTGTTGTQGIQGATGIVQVVMGTDSTQRSTTSSTMADTNLSVSITPTSSSNKVLVTWTHECESQSNNSIRGHIQLLRGSTVIASYSPVTQVNTGQPNGDACVASGTYLDSPATTSATTYKTQFAKSGTGSYSETFYINRLNDGYQSVATIVAKEIR